MQERAFDAVAVTEFLRQLLRRVSGPVRVIWDGAPIHRSQVVKPFLQTEANARLRRKPALIKASFIEANFTNQCSNL